MLDDMLLVGAKRLHETIAASREADAALTTARHAFEQAKLALAAAERRRCDAIQDVTKAEHWLDQTCGGRPVSGYCAACDSRTCGHTGRMQ